MSLLENTGWDLNLMENVLMMGLSSARQKKDYLQSTPLSIRSI